MFHSKTPEEIALMREGGRILARILRAVSVIVAAGVTTGQLNDLAEQLIRESGVMSAFKGYRNFPAALCVSVNDEVVHGVPSDRLLMGGDVVGLDLGIKHRELFTDTALTVGIEPLADEARELIKVAREALAVGIRAAQPGATTGDVGCAIESFVRSHGFAVVRDLVGHGIGRAPHEEPAVPNFGKAQSGPTLEVGMTLAIEPMVVAGEADVLQAPTGVWKTRDGFLSAHFEHTVAIVRGGARTLTLA
ncbi:type I methionyl aminopeptidase [Candidatus Parcubacteria bacterium]|nr:type I methionyl aminopeptidase [Candidatus Parcubacteria bacterium]